MKRLFGIDLPQAMYTIQNAPREVHRNVAPILAILVYKTSRVVVQPVVEYAAKMPVLLTNHFYRMAAVVMTPTLPHAIVV